MSLLFLVTFPRSGQHYMQRMIERVTGRDDYCELYSCRFNDCPGKNLKAQNRMPCLAGKTIQKNHDFDLTFKCNSSDLYAIFFRNPLDSLISYYEREKRKSGLALNWDEKGQRLRVEDSRDAWLNFLKNRSIYWNLFMSKWDKLSCQSNVKLFKYEDLTVDKEVFLQFFSFAFSEDFSLEANKIMTKQINSLNSGNGHKFRNARDFRFYDSESISIIKDTIDPALLNKLSYKFD